MVRLLQTLAASMSVALENARLWEKENLYRRALEREFEIGRKIQAGFLPENIPQPYGWEIAASLKPAREVAGDFYDVFALQKGQDRAGDRGCVRQGPGRGAVHDPVSQPVAGCLQHGCMDTPPRAWIAYRDRLFKAVSLTNNYIAETHGSACMFATVSLGSWTCVRAARLRNGGHAFPLLADQKGVKQTLELTGGPGRHPGCGI